MTLPVQEDVLRLQISVDDVDVVKVGQGRDNLCGVEPDGAGGQSVVHPHVGEQLAPAVEWEQEVQIVRVLPAVGQ